ncbi:sodium-coupled monocarboxylate transporter 1-like [Lutzomyia longipalpis]|uniref:sodium-coupled monocarboxylate transporter 1-like n=1 Tax=Lutzomyia longipalpis TaxID=7200 RepID=UPI002483B9CF|nr:sodium-coupled monocarboxylate transporter 1-like [Lutzomyia longipalpis]
MTADLERFSTLDFFFFAITFLLSSAIGLYYGFLSRRTANTREEYLLGGRKMGLLPITASLVATVVSGSTVLGHTTEVYAFGTQAWLLFFAFSGMSVIALKIYLPVFLEIGELSSFKYLELRFSRSVRLFASGLFTLTSLLFLPVTVYVPALAFHEVSGLSVHLITGLLTLLCVSYTAIGGIKAVVWTDVLQITLTVLSSATVAIVGINQVGGLEKVWRTADQGGRLIFFNWNPDPTARSTALQYFISMTVVAVYQIGINQTSIQRFLALSDMRKIRFAIWGLTIAFSLILFLSQTIGTVIYATYEACDPFRSGQVQKIDQILPHYIEHTASIFPGFTGIFIAGIFSASLSSTSSFLNTLSGSIYDDFLAQRFFHTATESRASNIVKLIVVLLGILQMFLLLLIEKLGTIFNMTVQMMNLATAALLGLFTLGMLSRRVNNKGALCGSTVSILVVVMLIVGGQYKKPDPMLPLRTDGCDLGASNATNSLLLMDGLTTITMMPPLPSSLYEEAAEDIPWIFRIHFLYHALIGFILNLLVGYTVSLLTGGNRIPVNEKLLAKFLRKKSHHSAGEEEEKKALKSEEIRENGKVIIFQQNILNNNKSIKK